MPCYFVLLFWFKTKQNTGPEKLKICVHVLLFPACQNCVHVRVYAIRVSYNSVYGCSQLTPHTKNISSGFIYLIYLLINSFINYLFI